MPGKPNPVGPVGQNVAANVKRIREAKNLTVTQFSRRLAAEGCHMIPISVYRLERGERHADADDLVAMAHVLEVDLAALLGDPASSSSAMGFVTRSEIEEMISSAIRRFSAGHSLDACPSSGESSRQAEAAEPAGS